MEKIQNLAMMSSQLYRKCTGTPWPEELRCIDTTLEDTPEKCCTACQLYLKEKQNVLNTNKGGSDGF